MAKLITAVKLMKTPSHMIQPMVSNGMLKWMPDKVYAKLVYKAIFGEELNLENPCTFNEKLQWLKLYYRKPEFTMMVDKYRVRKYIEKQIGKQYLVPLLGVWKSVDEIDFDTLPNQFVLKCNHDQGSVMICKDKEHFDIEGAKKFLTRKLSKNHYWFTREWPYKNVKPCIICEKYMEDSEGNGSLSDYKVLCFNGEPKLIELHKDRFGKIHTQDFYDANWNRTTIEQACSPLADEVMEKPAFFNEMMDLSRKLSEGLPHIRVDWYYTNHQLYFSELTFYDASGFEPFLDDYDKEIGEWITLPPKYNS